MTKRCNAVGVRVFVDVVFNHMTGNQEPAIGTGGSKADTKNLLYPAVPFGPGDFHQNCQINDYNNPDAVRNCELVGLHDLNQSSEYVRHKIDEFLDRVIDNGAAGFR